MRINSAIGILGVFISLPFLPILNSSFLVHATDINSANAQVTAFDAASYLKLGSEEGQSNNAIIFWPQTAAKFIVMLGQSKIKTNTVKIGLLKIQVKRK